MILSFNNLSLANEHSSQIIDMRVNGTRHVQETPLFRAIAAGLFARGNKSLRIDLTVATTFPTVTDAESHALTHGNDLPEQGDLVMTTGEAHETRITCELKDAALLHVNSHAKVCTTRTQYVFIGKQLLSTGAFDPLDGGDYLGAGEYGSPLVGSIDGGSFADTLLPTSLNIDGSSYA